MTELLHPETEDIVLAQVLAALGDETRLAIVGLLARNDQEPMPCSRFLHLGSKTGLSYHLAKLREAGLVRVRPEGTKRLITLRKSDLDQRFPGLLDPLVSCTLAEPPAQQG
jgi:DNA-binding transcriptional ArsR family regulator